MGQAGPVARKARLPLFSALLAPHLTPESLACSPRTPRLKPLVRFTSRGGVRNIAMAFPDKPHAMKGTPA